MITYGDLPGRLTMRKLTKSEIKVLNQLYHMESMYTLQDETGPAIRRTL